MKRRLVVQKPVKMEIPAFRAIRSERPLVQIQIPSLLIPAWSYGLVILDQRSQTLSMAERLQYNSRLLIECFNQPALVSIYQVINTRRLHQIVLEDLRSPDDQIEGLLTIRHLYSDSRSGFEIIDNSLWIFQDHLYEYAQRSWELLLATLTDQQNQVFVWPRHQSTGNKGCLILGQEVTNTTESPR